ncbi:MAG: hypothetical protein IKD99_07460 [Erysipelotrichaceae bacterium]|nr:hypothetical protein [Erysipelotrichaceae bacterium]
MSINQLTRKASKLSVIFLVVSLLAFLGYKIYNRMIIDKTPPIVTAPESILEASVSVTDNDLLRGVKAEDNKAGDVSDTLIVEKLSSIDSENNRIIYYIALDQNNNVGRAQRTVHYTDYQLPEFAMENGCFIVKIDGTINIINYIKASSVLDGDLSSFIKYSFDSRLDTSTLGEYPLQLYITDSAGGVSKLDTTLVVVSENELHEKIRLEQYLVYINVGDSFNPYDYITPEGYKGTLEIDSNVNTAQKGTYNVDYFVTNSTAYNTYRGRARLIVVVR